MSCYGIHDVAFPYSSFLQIFGGLDGIAKMTCGNKFIMIIGMVL